MMRQRISIKLSNRGSNPMHHINADIWNDLMDLDKGIFEEDTRLITLTTITNKKIYIEKSRQIACDEHRIYYTAKFKENTTEFLFNKLVDMEYYEIWDSLVGPVLGLSVLIKVEKVESDL